MRYRTFMSYNLICGFIWTVGVTLFGYFLGKVIPAEQVDKYLLKIVLGIIVTSLINYSFDSRKSCKQTLNLYSS